MVTCALALGLWFSPVPEGLVPAAWHLFALFVGRDRVGRDRRLPHPDRVGARPRRRRAHGHPRPREGLLGLRERHDPPHRRGLPGRAGRREVRPGRAPRPPRGERLRPLHPRPRLQHLPGRRRHRPRVPEQHGPLRRPLPPRALGGRGGRGAAGRAGTPAAGQLPHVLGHRQPHASPPRSGSRPWPRTPSGPRSRAATASTIGFGSWLVASSVPTLAAMALLPLVLYKVIGTRGHGDARGAPRRAAGPRSDGPARRPREDRGRDVRGHGGPLGSGRDAGSRLDRGRLPGPRRAARDRRPDPRRTSRRKATCSRPSSGSRCSSR